MGYIWNRIGAIQANLGISIDSQGNVFVADYVNHRIQKFGSDSTYIRQWGQLGSGDGEFRFPMDVAVDTNGNVFVTDTGNDRTQKFSNTGEFIRSWGASGTDNGQFMSPVYIDVDSQGNVFVAGTVNHRIQKFTNTGTFLTKTIADITYPRGMSTDFTGNVYLSDETEIKEFSTDLHFLSKWGHVGNGPGQWFMPVGLDVVTPGFVSFKKYVYVTDPGSARVQIYFWEPDIHPRCYTFREICSC